VLISAASALTVPQGQWAPPGVLGFPVLGAGLLPGARNPAADGSPVSAPPLSGATASSRVSALLPGLSAQRPPSVLRPAHK
ncbi:MAG: hypothetical protein H7343_05130, partial [Undibacterium sp.]|nr:hypothetical protein [Opitutaceae bacterium]